VLALQWGARSMVSRKAKRFASSWLTENFGPHKGGATP
jgi:hypothetical protein